MSKRARTPWQHAGINQGSRSHAVIGLTTESYAAAAVGLGAIAEAPGSPWAHAAGRCCAPWFHPTAARYAAAAVGSGAVAVAPGELQSPSRSKEMLRPGRERSLPRALLSSDSRYSSLMSCVTYVPAHEKGISSSLAKRLTAGHSTCRPKYVPAWHGSLLYCYKAVTPHCQRTL